MIEKYVVMHTGMSPADRPEKTGASFARAEVFKCE